MKIDIDELMSVRKDKEMTLGELIDKYGAKALDIRGVRGQSMLKTRIHELRKEN